MKRLFDVVFAALALTLTSPFVLAAALFIFLQDGRSPWYKPERIGLRGLPFTMYKLRSMVVDADISGLDSTAKDDARITYVGAICRAMKLDEVPQFMNVLRGEMSVVGPRPQLRREVDRYTEVERGLLDAKPGITDIASIVFADLGSILENSADANLTYNQLVRPWKSQLGLFYVQHRTMTVDLGIVILTALSSLSRKRALHGITRLLCTMNAPEELVRISARRGVLTPAPPPGSAHVVERLDG